MVVWPADKNTNIADSCRRAIQCALDIQSKLNKVEMSPGKPLSVKIGLGVGECNVLYVGGQFKRCEYLIVGEAMRQACEAETHATEGGQTICCETVYKYVRNYYSFEEAKGDGSHGPPTDDSPYYKVLKLTGERVAIKADAYLMRTHFSSDKLREKLPQLKTFVPAAISIYLDIEKENFSKEIRMLTIMFLNLKLDLASTKNEEGMKKIQDIALIVQRCVYRTKGSLNKFLMDDKGSVMLIIWGLPPLSSPDDQTRSVLTALDLAKELKTFNITAYMGITTGTCFTGVCGTLGGRREYSLLGEIVNLSARFMQKAIYYAKELQEEKKKKVESLILICDKTRDLIQNKIQCDYVTQGELKGFSNSFYFYEPKSEIKPPYESYSFFLPDLKTHKNNILLGHPNPDEKEKTPDNMLKNALYMVGRKEYLLECCGYLQNVYKNYDKDFILIRGITGSGKSLFLRKLLYEFIDSNKELKNRFNIKIPFIFISFQTPNTLYEPMNGWAKILREIYSHFKGNLNDTLNEVKFKLGGEAVLIKCDTIGEILLNSDCLSYVRYIEEILDCSLSAHYELPNDSIFTKFFQIKELPPRDPFFEFRKFDKLEKNICRFFVKLIKKYREDIISDFPLLFVIEDVHLIDELSIELIRALGVISNNNSKSLNDTIKGLCVLVTYQDPINGILRNQFDRFSRANDLFFAEKTFLMDPITDMNQIQDLIRYNSQSKINFTHLSPILTTIIVTKSLKGNPLFIIDIVNSLIDSGFVKQGSNSQLDSTSELNEMFENNDWIKFSVPIRMEKLIGHIIDSLSTKEIIILKYASVIGNIFDIDKLNELNPFNSVTFDDLMSILYNLENFGILEILYDINPKQMVCKFNIPFIREILYQRMLIEQRNDIHLNIARGMQYSKFSYMTHKQEMHILKNHLKTTEKTILAHMEDKEEEVDDNKSITTSNQITEPSLNINNLKIIEVKEICEKLRKIDLRIDDDESGIFSNNGEINKRLRTAIKRGLLNKKSDKGITWEDRYFVVTNTKLFYWYYERDFLDNKMPLGSFDLKNLYQVQLLNDKEIGQKNNLFLIQVSSWQKKEVIKPARRYYFSCNNRDQLYSWIITLNFLRVKAIYDEFTNNFGVINLPLIHEIRGKNKRKLKTKFKNRKNNTSTKATSSSMYMAVARRSVMTNKSSSNNNFGSVKDNSITRRMSINTLMLNDNLGDDFETLDKLPKIKDLISFCFSYGFASLMGFMQDIILNVENVGMNEDRMVHIPIHLSEFKLIPSSGHFNSIISNTITYNNDMKKSSVSFNNKINSYNINNDKEIDHDSEDDSGLNSLIIKKSENNLKPNDTSELDISKDKEKSKQEDRGDISKGNNINLSFQNNKHEDNNTNININYKSKTEDKERKNYDKQFTLQSINNKRDSELTLPKDQNYSNNNSK